MFSIDKLNRLILAGVFLGFAMYAFRGGLAGSIIWLHLFALLLIIGLLVFWLKDRYWILIPITLFSGFEAIQVFGRGIRASELVIIACSVIFFARMALLRAPIRIRPILTWPILIHFIWIAVIFAINPVGLAVAGGQAIGGRFYIQIVLAFLATIILASQSVSERETKTIIFYSILLSFIVPLQSILRVTQAVEMANPDDFYTWHQALTRPAMLILFFLLAKYRKLNLSFIVLYLAAMALVLASGKRATFVLFGSLPIISAWLLYRSYANMIFRAAATALMIGMIILSHGTLFNLPRIAQRAMALLPGRWDRSVEHLHEDVFRQEIRKIAWYEIQNRPLMGRRGYTLRRDDIIYLQMFQTGRGDVFGGHAYSANWHSAWLAFWVDFGFPAVLLFATFLINALFFGRKVFQESQDFNHFRVLSGMLLLHISSTVITSYTSGHSALTLFANWWVLGLMVAIQRGIHARHVATSKAEALTDMKSNISTPMADIESRKRLPIPPHTIPDLALAVSET